MKIHLAVECSALSICLGPTGLHSANGRASANIMKVKCIHTKDTKGPLLRNTGDTQPIHIQSFLLNHGILLAWHLLTLSGLGGSPMVFWLSPSSDPILILSMTFLTSWKKTTLQRWEGESPGNVPSQIQNSQSQIQNSPTQMQNTKYTELAGVGRSAPWSPHPSPPPPRQCHPS